MKRTSLLAVVAAFAVLAAGCSGNEGGSSAADNSTSTGGDTNISSVDDSAFSDRDYEVGYNEPDSIYIELKGDTATCDSDTVDIDGSIITITGDGTYVLSGQLDDGMIVIDSTKENKLQLVLNGVSVTSSNCAPLYIRQADKIFVTVADGSENTLANGGTFTAIDDNNIDSVIFSKEDITFNGSGKLIIQSPAGHGIVSKDDLVLTSGNYDITAASHGMKAKDAVMIANASFKIDSGKDGIQCDNSEDDSLGYVYIESGTFDITSGGDGISSSSYTQIDSGVFDILSGGGSNVKSSSSCKGLKAGGSLLVNGGEYKIDSADDAVHANSSIEVNGGSFEIASGDDAVHTDEKLTVNNGNIVISKSYEGLEGLCMEFNGGEITLTSSDDGLNAGGGNDQSGFGGGDIFSSNESSYININGGTLNVNAGGDGIDSNGAVNVTGGATYIAGPTNGGNGAFDYAGKAQITGGVFIAAGPAQMAVNFTSAENQGVMMVNLSGASENSVIELKDSDGTVLLSWTSPKKFDSVVISCPEIQQGKTYTVTCGSSTATVTMDSLVYGSGNGMGGFGGGMGGHGGGNFGGGARPGAPENFDGTMPELPDGAEFPDGFGGGMKPDGGRFDQQPPSVASDIAV